MNFISPPYLTQNLSVRRIMLEVLAALLPAILVYVYLIGPIVLIQLAFTICTCLFFEYVLLKMRGKPVTPFLYDGSAIVTGALIALALPPFSPWWLLAVASFFAIVVAKQLYGGLGQNPFNPAMIAFAVCIVSFPSLMAQWPPAYLHDRSFESAVHYFLSLSPKIDGMTSATPLDALKTALRAGEGEVSVSTILDNTKVFGYFAGRGWEWVGLAYLVGGLFLLYRGIIRWYAPMSFILGITLIATLLWVIEPKSFASPLFHVFSGGTLLGAFFIVTDPVSGATTKRGLLIFGGLAGAFTYIIRVFGGYPDGVAFGVLLMNLCVPLIDMYTQPPVFGKKS